MFVHKRISNAQMARDSFVHLPDLTKFSALTSAPCIALKAACKVSQIPIKIWAV